MKKTLTHTEAMEVVSPDGGVNIGGSQEWYRTVRQQRSGCGPTAASGVMWYLSKTRPGLAALCAAADNAQSSFLTLMETMFAYVTPGRGGVNTTAIFTNGAERYGVDLGVPLQTHTQEISTFRRLRPTLEALRTFLLNAIESDLPVAFLNLSSGALRNLDNWHWVLIIGLDPDSMMATICDQGKFWDIDMAGWLRTSFLGGGMVVVS
jgi:hypothetical protein